MSITTGVGKKFLEELPLCIHTLAEGNPSSDIIKVALYGPAAIIGPELTEAYTTDGEVSGSGYTAGGVTLDTGLIVVGRSGSSRNGGVQFEHPYIQPVDNTQVSVSGVAVRGCLMYNASQDNRTIFTLDFGDTVSPTAGIVLNWGVAGVTQFKDTLIPLTGQIF